MKSSIKRYLIPIGIIFIGLSAFLYYMLFHFMELDEDKILTNSTVAFEEEKYDDRVQDNEKELTDLAIYLIGNSNKIVAISDANKNPCQTISIKANKIVQSTMDVVLKDSLEYYLSKIDVNLLKRLQLCTKTDRKQETLIIKLNIDKKDQNNPDYRLDHSIYVNKEFKEKNQINSILESLQKKKVINDKLVYGISIYPYSGF